MEIASVFLKTADLLLKITSSPIAKEIQSIWKYESEIKRFSDTVAMIGDVLSDMEAQRFQLKSVERGYKRLREAYLDAEDFLDGVEAHRKKLEAHTSNFNKEKEEMMNKANTKTKQLLGNVHIKKKAVSIKISRFFSGSNPVKHAVKMHKAIKKIRRNLDEIEIDMKLMKVFKIKEPSTASETTDRMSHRATGPFVDADKIVGRGEDKEKLVGLLLDSSADPQKIPVISIVGIGGMGKTTTAQLLYEDESWQKSCKFDLKIWVSDSKKFDVESMLKNILKSLSPKDAASVDTLGGTQLRERLVEEIGGKRFLLVLDDVEDDDVENDDVKTWENLESLLNRGNKKESRILVTTRSRKVADVMGSDSTYELRGLSETDALQLFERYAFRRRRDEDLVEIGEHVVKKCLGVPLAIQVIGSLLDGKDRSMWERVRDTDLAINDENNRIIPVLMISYNNLDSTSKQCFSYCALFPKNYPITWGILSSIWRVNVRALEYDCEKYLKTLCDRCLLMKDYLDRYTMHDLIHDLATKVAGEEMRVMNSNAKMDSNKFKIEENVRHVSLMVSGIKVDGTSTLEVKGRRLRTLLLFAPPAFDELVLDCPALRLLDISWLGIKNLPNSIGKLIHLRHLDLSSNQFQTMPNSIVELINLKHLSLANCGALTHMPSGMDALTSLEVLDISECEKLEELPMGIGKITNLRHLDLAKCGALTHLPSGMGALTSLEFLDISECRKLEELPMGLEKIINLRHLNLAECGALTHMPSGHVKLEEQLKGIEKLINLRVLNLESCKELTHLPCGIGELTSLEILNLSYCGKLEELPVSIEKLINLKRLELSNCTSLTHIPPGMGLLTSLESLDITECGKLKELPAGIVKLINFKHLKLEGCNALTHLPAGIGALKSLCEFDKFIVGDPDTNHSAQLEELGCLSETEVETIKIELPNNIRLKESWVGEAFLLNKTRLWELEIRWQGNGKEELPSNHMGILATLQPPPNLERFTLDGYQGTTFPLWVPNDDFASVLPQMTNMFILNCGKIQQLPPLNRLACLASLTLCGLSNLEYIEENVSGALSFSSLRSIKLDDLPKLKGWCRGPATEVDEDGTHEQSLLLPSFPRLYSLKIFACPNLMLEPILVSFHKVFSVNREETHEQSSLTTPALSSSSVNLFVQVCTNGGGFDLSNCDSHLHLSISKLNVSEHDPSINMVDSFREMSKHIKLLAIYNWSGLKTLPTEVKHLSALTHLIIEDCCAFTGEEEDGQVSWKDLQSLELLRLSELPKMVRLPQGIQFLTSLKLLVIVQCDNLLLPEWLYKTFKSETGVYWNRRVEQE